MKDESGQMAMGYRGIGGEIPVIRNLSEECLKIEEATESREITERCTNSDDCKDSCDPC